MTGLQVWLHPSSRTVKQFRVSGFQFRVVPEDARFPHTRNLKLETGNFYTRRLFGGRHPLCGIGVKSLIERTSMPEAASARIADSRPEPGPLTRTSTERTP